MILCCNLPYRNASAMFIAGCLLEVRWFQATIAQLMILASNAG